MRRSVFLGGLGTALLASSCKNEMPEIRIALNPWPGYMFLDLAQQRGLFAAAGLKIKLIFVSSLSDVVQTYQRGQSDIIATSLIEALTIAEKTSRPLRIFQAVDSSHGADVLLARPEYKTVADLKGKRICAEPKTLDRLTLRMALQSAGLKSSEVSLVPLVQQAALEPLNREKIDAVQTYPPFCSQWLKVGFKPVFDSSMIPGKILDVLSIDRSVEQAHPGLCALISQAYDAAYAWYLENPKDGAEMMLQTVKASDPVSGATAADYNMEGIKIYGAKDQQAFFQGGSLAKVIDTYVEGMLEEKMLSRSVAAKEVL